jgi:hypothetical protein
MTVIANTVARPHPGKNMMAQNRARQLAGIYARHGASVRVASVISGPNTGCVVISRAYPDFRAAAKAFNAINNDPVHVEFWREREANPGADIVIGRDIARTVHGELRWSTHAFSHIRVYEIARDKLADALKLLPDVSKLVSKADANVVALVPVTGENLSTMMVAYQFRSIDAWAEGLDTVGTSDEFQAIVNKAAKFGTLRSSFAMTPL